MLAQKNIPNLLTFGRVLAVPVALYLMTVGARPLLAVFILASITDFLDGFLARKWNATSALGTMLDPIADKLLVTLMLLYLMVAGHAPLLPIAAIILREIYVAGLREFLALRGIPLPVSHGGKLKTALQMLAIIALTAALAFVQQQAWIAGIWLLWAAAAVSLVTAALYTLAALPPALRDKYRRLLFTMLRIGLRS